MDWKTLLKPNLSNLTVFIILFVFFSFLPTGFTKNALLSFKVFPQINTLGFPISFFEKNCFATQVLGGSVNCSNQIRYINLSLDIIFSYIISAVIISLFTKKI